MHEDSDVGIAAFQRRNLRAGDTALDVGANQGLHTGGMAEAVGPTGSVHAFEANPDVAAGLRTRFQAARNVRVHEMAVTDTSGPVTFHMDMRPGVGGAASSLLVFPDLHTRGEVKTVTVQATTLDEFCHQNAVIPHLIKIDVEGFELNVIRGAAQIIAAHRPVLVFEFWETWWERSIRHIFDYLKPAYTLIRLEDGANVDDFYYHNRRDGIADIGCLPRADACASRDVLDPRKLLTRAA
jgi:FkbM family methyltransferase